MSFSEQTRQRLAIERDHLAAAQRDVLQGEQRVAEQVELLERLKRGGHDTAQALAFLEALEQTLSAWREHREQICLAIARLEHRQG